jgi:hypothetical protein
VVSATNAGLIGVDVDMRTEGRIFDPEYPQIHKIWLDLNLEVDDWDCTWEMLWVMNMLDLA